MELIERNEETRRLSRAETEALTALSPDLDIDDSSSGASNSNVQVDENTLEIEQWVRQANNGELDFYTVFGISSGREGFGKNTRALIPSLMMILFLQGVVPVLLCFWFARHHNEVVHHDLEFRVIGFGLYMYAVWGMYQNALDECRSGLLIIAAKHKASFMFTAPLYLGELTNAYTGWILTVSLFFIFTNCVTPVELILNSLAINYLVSIDNEFVDDETRDRTLMEFRAVFDCEPPKTEKADMHMTLVLTSVFTVLRVVGILVLGSIFAIAYLFTREDVLCSHLHFLRTVVPFCEEA